MKAIFDTAIAYKRWASLEIRAIFGTKARARSSRHLALFAWALPPSTWAGVYRPLSFLEHSAESGWRISAFGGEPNSEDRIGGEELLARIPGSCTIRRLSPSPLRPSWSLFPRVNGGLVDAIEFAHTAIEVLRDDPPTAVLASGPTFDMFITGAFVSRRFRVPLVLDYRDEWSESPFSFISPARDDRKWEQRCLERANRVLFTTGSQREHQLKVFPMLASEKTLVLPNGWDPAEFTAEIGARRPLSAASCLRIALIGNLADHAPPDGFLETFARLLNAHPSLRAQVLVEFIGRKSPGAAASLAAFSFPENIRDTPHLAKTQAVQVMREADALLLVALPELQRYLPGKLFDYLAAGRPIIVYGAPGEASRLVAELDAGFHCPEGDDGRLYDIVQELRAGSARPQSILRRRWLERHRRDVLAGNLFAILEELQR